MNPSPYKDLRSEFFKKYFEAGAKYDEYVASGSESEQSKWRGYEELVALSDSNKSIVENFKREMNIIVMSGIWCGDCVRQGPIFKAIEDANSLMRFRFIDNKQNPELKDELRLNGAEKVPVVVALSEDFFEVARFGDRHLSVYRKKAETELGAACDAGIIPPSAESMETEISEWVQFFERLQIMLRLAPALRKRHGD